MKDLFRLTVVLSSLLVACGGSSSGPVVDASSGDGRADADLTTGLHPTTGTYLVAMSHVAGFCFSTYVNAVPETQDPATRSPWKATVVVGTGTTTSGRYVVSWTAWWPGAETFDWRSRWPSVTGGGSFVGTVGNGTPGNPTATLTVTAASIGGEWVDPTTWHDDVVVDASCTSGSCDQDPIKGNLPCTTQVHRDWVLQ